jgi:hypothetical protein
MSLGFVSRWSLSLLGWAVDLNSRIEAQLPKNDYRDQFAIDPAQTLAILAALGVVMLAAAVVALKLKDIR